MHSLNSNVTSLRFSLTCHPTFPVPFGVHPLPLLATRFPKNSKMPILSATLGGSSSSIALSFLESSTHNYNYAHPSSFSVANNNSLLKVCHKLPLLNRPLSSYTTRASVSISDNPQIESNEPGAANGPLQDSSPSSETIRLARRSADWKAARAYHEKGLIYEGRIEGYNIGGLLVRFYSLVGFLPFPQLGPSLTYKGTKQNIQEVARSLVGSLIPMKVITADEDNRQLIFSEKEAVWSKYSKDINVGDIFEAKVGPVEDYGAFVHLRFPDGRYHLTGLVHISEVSWDLVQDVRDILSEGDDVKVKIISIDRKRSRITLSIKQLEDDPLLETLDKVIPQDGAVDPGSSSLDDAINIQPLPGLDMIFGELLKEEGIEDIRINRQGFEKRVVSQDLQLWLSNAPPVEKTFVLLARAGRQVQEIQLTTSLDQEGIKAALQRVLERVP